MVWVWTMAAEIVLFMMVVQWSLLMMVGLLEIRLLWIWVWCVCGEQGGSWIASRSRSKVSIMVWMPWGLYFLMMLRDPILIGRGVGSWYDIFVCSLVMW